MVGPDPFAAVLTVAPIGLVAASCPTLLEAADDTGESHPADRLGAGASCGS